MNFVKGAQGTNALLTVGNQADSQPEEKRRIVSVKDKMNDLVFHVSLATPRVGGSKVLVFHEMPKDPVNFLSAMTTTWALKPTQVDKIQVIYTWNSVTSFRNAPLIFKKSVDIQLLHETLLFDLRNNQRIYADEEVLVKVVLYVEPKLLSLDTAMSSIVAPTTGSKSGAAESVADQVRIQSRLR